MTLFLLHAQGPDTPTLAALAPLLTDVEVVGLDLTAADDQAEDGVVDGVVDTIAAHAPGRWALAGLGTGREVAVEVADRTLGGEAPLFGLAGVVPLDSDEPADVARTVQQWWHEQAGRGPAVPDDFARVLASDHTSARTRGTLAVRALGDDPAYAPRTLDVEQLTTLRAVAGRVVPQGGVGPGIDLAARVDAQLADGIGDGWRHDGQPVDVEAYRAGLDALAGFADLDSPEQDARLRALAGDPWFEDCCTDLVRQWLAHPATMARIGFDGVANGGDGEFQGFTRLTLTTREDWEPSMEPSPEPVVEPVAG